MGRHFKYRNKNNLKLHNFFVLRLPRHFMFKGQASKDKCKYASSARVRHYLRVGIANYYDIANIALYK